MSLEGAVEKCYKLFQTELYKPENEGEKVKVLFNNYLEIKKYMDQAKLNLLIIEKFDDISKMCLRECIKCDYSSPRVVEIVKSLKVIQHSK